MRALDAIQMELHGDVTRQLRSMDNLGVLTLRGFLDPGDCQTCGRANQAEGKDRLKALDILWSRTGRPAMSSVQVTGSVEVTEPTNTEADATILRGAADIAKDGGEYELATAIEKFIEARAAQSS